MWSVNLKPPVRTGPSVQLCQTEERVTDMEETGATSKVLDLHIT